MADGKQGIAGPKQDEDLEENPSIGQSQGGYASGEDLADAEGENMLEGDVENDPEADGSIDPDRLGRTNK
ncbi:MAG: hypothetical protein AB1431_04265 [Pseudomonadota bacterium]|nr:hypothetical protein [Pseudomonadota bacterium]|tara:strand:+ start:2200 stop:2409 length:210 start_codon:yes stop_codon:yes gene_type:complete